VLYCCSRGVSSRLKKIRLRQLLFVMLIQSNNDGWEDESTGYAEFPAAAPFEATSCGQQIINTIHN
jgi:hypothetical protein